MEELVVLARQAQDRRDHLRRILVRELADELGLTTRGEPVDHLVDDRHDEILVPVREGALPERLRHQVRSRRCSGSSMPTSGYGPITTLMNSRIDPDGNVTLSRMTCDDQLVRVDLVRAVLACSSTGVPDRLAQKSGYGSRTSPATPVNWPIGSNGTIGR